MEKTSVSEPKELIITRYNPPDWFTDRQRLSHWASLNDKVTLPLFLRWKSTLPASVRSSITGGHGHIYAGSDDNKLYALSPHDGSVLWTFNTGGRVSSAATAIDEKTFKGLFITSENGKLYSLEPSNGREIWHVGGGVGPFISSTNYASGLVFYVFMSSVVASTARAVDSTTGAIKWQGPTFNVSSATPMHAFGSLFVGVGQVGQNFFSLNDITGNEAWHASDSGADAGCYTSGVANMDVGSGSQATVIISTKGGVVKALSMSGSQVWVTTLQGKDPITGFALTQNRRRNILVVSRESDLYALDAKNGAILWQYPYRSSSMANRKSPRPAIWGNYAFHIREGDKLVAVSLQNGLEKWSAELDGATLSSPTVGGKTVYIGTSSGSVYAFSNK